MELWEQDGRIFVKTAEIEKSVSSKTLMDEIQKNFFIDLGFHPIKIIRSREMKGDICPYCGSKETIGHGSRTTRKELQIRRWCNGCNRTFIAGKAPAINSSENQKTGTKGTVRFLHLLGFNKNEIIDRLDISWSTVNEGVKKLEIELETEFLENYYFEHEIDGHESDEDLRITKAPDFILKTLMKDNLGLTNIWDYDGRIALQNKKIAKNPIFLFKDDIKFMLTLPKTENHTRLRDIPADEREVILTYIEDRKDDMMGILPKTHIFTRIADDSGELNAGLMESSAHRDTTEEDSNDQ